MPERKNQADGQPGRAASVFCTDRRACRYERIWCVAAGMGPDGGRKAWNLYPSGS